MSDREQTATGIGARLENIEAKLAEILELLRGLWLAEERRLSAGKPQREA